MAEEDVMNFLLRRFSGSLNRQFISVDFVSMRYYFSQPRHLLPSRHSILTFAVTVLLNFLQIKYQNKTKSPFETHPRTMFVAVTSVIMYCLSYDANLRVSSSTDHISSRSYVCIVRSSIAFFGPLFLASLSSLLFPERLCPVVFSVSVLFTLCELPCSKFRIVWNWVQQVMIRINLRPAGPHQQGVGGIRRRRRLPASLHLSRLSEHATEFVDQVDVNPPV